MIGFGLSEVLRESCARRSRHVSVVNSSCQLFLNGLVPSAFCAILFAASNDPSICPKSRRFLHSHPPLKAHFSLMIVLSAAALAFLSIPHAESPVVAFESTSVAF